jgi:hypothetical protein
LEGIDEGLVNICSMDEKNRKFVDNIKDKKIMIQQGLQY